MTPTGYLTIARITGPPADLLESYRRSSEIMDRVGRDHELILHAGAPTSAGLLIVNLWPSRDNSEAAARDPRRLSAMRQAGLAPGQQRQMHYAVERYVLFPTHSPEP